MPEYDSRRYAMANRWDPSHLKRIDRLLAMQPGDRVLEVGCGRGHLTMRLAGRGIDVVGIDANPNAPEVSDSDRVLHMNAEDLEFGDAEFDSIVSVHAIEHIPPLEKAASEMSRVLKPGGRALFVYPAEPIQGLYAVPTSVILYGTPFKARQVHCHRLTPAKVRRLMESYGLVETYHEFNLFRSPQFISVFAKASPGAG
ncbi:MAG TPA: methyltransferase domain-containing protein [Acidimicrobiia bacterium]|nr:methyltransferase domain-containing protein [Acidimicrobiia bacterium]